MSQHSVSTADPTNQRHESSTNGFWGTRFEALLWALACLTAAYLFFGIGIAIAVTGLLLILKFLTKSKPIAQNVRGLFAKVVITGIAYQFMGAVLISGPNLVNAKLFYEEADVDFKHIKLVDSLNYRLSMHKIEITYDDFEKLVGFYRKSTIDNIAEDREYGDTERFAYYEFEPEALSQKYSRAYEFLSKYDHEIDALINLEKIESAKDDQDWLYSREQARNLFHTKRTFPEINENHGRCRVLFWDSGSTTWFFVWIEKKQTGYLMRCSKGFG